MKRRALITGICGQDGSYLSELLLAKGYDIYGLDRSYNARDIWRIRDIVEKITLLDADLGDADSIGRIIDDVRPDEVYNLAAQSNVQLSFDAPLDTTDINGLGVVRLIEAILHTGLSRCRIFQASSSAMFGKAKECPQNEKTGFATINPYAISKTYAHMMCRYYRETKGLFVACGILFNHESPRRGAEFVTRKIARAAARISLGLENRLKLGDLEARRDWGFAGDYVEAMWLMMQKDEPEDYVIGTGESHSVREFLDRAFGEVNLKWENYVVIDNALMRPGELNMSMADAAKAEKELGWKPRTGFDELVHVMVQAELERHGSDHAVDC